MNSFIQVVGTIASILSIPLAIYFYLKANDRTYEKVRRDIIKTLSYRVGEGIAITANDITSVYNSKIREYKINGNVFNEKDILDDLKCDVISNPFLRAGGKDSILNSLNRIDFDAIEIIALPRYKIILQKLLSPFVMGLFILAAPLISFIALLPNIRSLLIDYTIIEQETNSRFIYDLLVHAINNPIVIACFIVFIISIYVFIYMAYARSRGINHSIFGI